MKRGGAITDSVSTLTTTVRGEAFAMAGPPAELGTCTVAESVVLATGADNGAVVWALARPRAEAAKTVNVSWVSW